MLMHAGNEAYKIYKTFHWAEEGDAMKSDKVIKLSMSTTVHSS